MIGSVKAIDIDGIIYKVPFAPCEGQSNGQTLHLYSWPSTLSSEIYSTSQIVKLSIIAQVYDSLNRPWYYANANGKCGWGMSSRIILNGGVIDQLIYWLTRELVPLWAY